MKHKFRSSRISFIGNYFLGISLLFLMFVVNLTLTLPAVVTYSLLIVAMLLFLEPEGIIIYKIYKLESDHISEIKGVFIKRRVDIPYRAIADHRLKKGIIGRVLNYGDVVITGPKIQIKMKGIRRPEKLCEEIENKLSTLVGSVNPTLLS